MSESTVEERLLAIESHIGMDITLRDYFAGQALVGLCEGDVGVNRDEAHIASVCGRFADAMLAERAKEEGG